MAINAPVEIFVIKTHSILNLDSKSSARFGCKNWRNPQLLVE